jgi:type IV pilus assembly protein PilA
VQPQKDQLVTKAPPAADEGFTLVEMLVVCLIIALLAAIALPVFLSQQEKAQDADAKSNARNLVSQVEACHGATEDYTGCDSVLELGTTGLPLVDGAPTTDATVGVESATRTTFKVTGQSKHASATFSIRRTAAGAIVRECVGSGGGCVGGAW